MSLFFVFYKFPFPNPNRLDPSVYESEPVIEKHDEKQFEKFYKGKKYQFTSYATYKMNALVVEKYDSENFLDVTHKNDPAQSKDLCIVWGDTAKNGKYLNARFSHGEFTCFFRSKSWDNLPTDLTNNHLIPKDDQIKKIMDKITIGDQVSIEAELVDYKILDEKGNTLLTRSTSLELGDHDCEVLYVNNIEIIKPINFVQRYIKNMTLKIGFITSILFIISLFI